MFVEYGKISTEMYEATKPVASSIDGDLEYYSDKLKKVSGAILEAGVGTGRMLIPFLKKGWKIDGVDLSPHMLDKCSENCKKHGVKTNLYLQDLKELDLPTTYDAIIMPTGSFALMPDRVSMSHTLTSFKHHLNKNGLLMIDLLFPVHFKAGEQSMKMVELNEQEGILFQATSFELDWALQRTTEIHRYEKWENGENVESELSKFTLAWYGVEEFTSILKDHGFHSIRHEWDYGKENGSNELVTFFARV